jgi:PAS domain-containing protein
MREAQRLVRSYGLSLTVTGLAFLLTILFWSLSQRLPFALCLCAVLVSGFLRGPEWGLATALLSAVLLVCMYAFVPVWDSPEPGSDYVVRLVMFLLVGLLGCYVSSVCRRAVSAVEGVHEVLEGAGTALVFADKERRVTFQNANARTLTEQSDIQALGKPVGRLVSLIDEKSRAPRELPLEQVRRDGRPVDLGEGLLMVSSSGKEIPVEGALAAVRDGDDRPDGIALTLRSVAEQRKTESDLRSRIRTLEANLADTRAELDEAVLAHEQVQAAKEHAEQHFAQARGELERLRVEHASAHEEITDKLRAAYADNQRHKEELEHAHARHGTLMQSRSEMERRLSQESELRERAEKRLAEKDAAHAQALESLRSTSADWEQRLAQSRREQEQMEEMLRAEAQELRRQLAEHKQARSQADEALRQTSVSFEREFEERTRSHASAQESLRNEIARRQGIEEKLRAAHEHLEGVVGQHADPLFAFDGQGRTTLWNKALEKITGLTSAEVVGQPITDVLGVLGQPEASQWVAGTLAGKSASVAFGPFPGAQADQPCWQGELTPLLGAANEIRGGTVILRILAMPLPAAPEPRATILRQDPAQGPHRSSRLTQEEHHARWLSFN